MADPIEFERDGIRFVLFVRQAALDPYSGKDATESDLSAAGFVPASRLAAAEACVKQFQRCADVLEELANGGPSTCCVADDGQLTAECSATEPCLGCRVQERLAAAENMVSKAAELETQLAEAKRRELAEAELYQQARVEELKMREKLEAVETDARNYEHIAKMTLRRAEAAEAERAHLLEAAELLRAGSSMPSTEWEPRKAAWKRRDHELARASAATEEPKYCEQFRDHDGRYDEICGRPMPCSEHSAKPQPHPQGARLGGPADNLERRIVSALRDMAGMADIETAPRAIVLQKLASALKGGLVKPL